MKSQNFLVTTRVALAAALALSSAGSALAEKVQRRSNDLSFGGSENLDPISPPPFVELPYLLCDQLILPAVDGTPQPRLALSWAANDTASEWSLKLRPGVKFHDGSDFAAADAKFSLERLNDPPLESPLVSSFGIISAVEVVDPLAAKIILSKPHADMPILIYDYRVVMLPSEAGDTITGDGTGQFRLDSFDPESTTEVVANPDCWAGAPKIDRVTFTANPAFDALLDKARVSLDMTKARELYVQAQKMLFEDGGTFIPYQEDGRRVLSSKVVGIGEISEDRVRRNEIDIA